MHRIRIAAAALAAVASAPGAAAAAPPQPAGADARQAATLRFTSAKPGRPTGLRLDVTYRNPANPGAKPPSARHVQLVLAPGGRFDAAAPVPCQASDVELMLRGPAACPPESRVGPGYVLIDSGADGPLRFHETDVDLIDGPGDEQIVLNTERRTRARVNLRGHLTERTHDIEFPLLPGLPPDGGAVAGGFVEFRPVVRGGRSYVTTPPRCPRSGHWTNTATFTYRDGVTQSATTRQRCERPRRRHRDRTRSANAHRSLGKGPVSVR